MFNTDHGLDIVIKCQQVLGACGCDSGAHD